MKRNHLTCDQSLKNEITNQLFDTWCDELFESALLKLEDGSSLIVKEGNFSLDCKKPFEDRDDEVGFVVLSDSNGLMKCPNCRHFFQLVKCLTKREIDGCLVGKESLGEDVGEGHKSKETDGCYGNKWCRAVDMEREKGDRERRLTVKYRGK
ncbi:hypothetical protein L6452_41827 [Arctium lappa]|uniref:Uncharacterized protein n=1 Tax=Arctium lappa TaxID=4217 RepID=A0ACB8XGZ1_ARCLA|nr:hypothetical protein L6452_41827 [Arctium lappa]